VTSARAIAASAAPSARAAAAAAATFWALCGPWSESQRDWSFTSAADTSTFLPASWPAIARV
jgi:hypothetical protein